MPPVSPSPRRLALLGCSLAAVAALALMGCASDGAATAENTPPAQVKPQAKTALADRPCPGQVDALLESLDTLRHQLAVGLSYEQYAAKVKSLRAAYDEIPIDHLTIACLSSAGTPAEDALNKYIDAANAWGECLADASCTTASIEPVLQRKWRVASRHLSEAR
jgi:hypothetical protein